MNLSKEDKAVLKDRYLNFLVRMERLVYQGYDVKEFMLEITEDENITEALLNWINSDD